MLMDPLNLCPLNIKWIPLVPLVQVIIPSVDFLRSGALPEAPCGFSGGLRCGMKGGIKCMVCIYYMMYLCMYYIYMIYVYIIYIDGTLMVFHNLMVCWWDSDEMLMTFNGILMRLNGRCSLVNVVWNGMTLWSWEWSLICHVSMDLGFFLGFLRMWPSCYDIWKMKEESTVYWESTEE